VPIRPDPGNGVSGKREAMELGERLFFDTRMSAGGKFSCATCHVPERNWTELNRCR
jgi:cytochrome c peroxidase